MDSIHVAWQKPVALALALGLLAQPVQSGLRLTTQANATVLTSGVTGYAAVSGAEQFSEGRDSHVPPATLSAQASPALPKPLVVPDVPIVAGSPTGYLPGLWDVNSSGVFTYSMPLDVPAGRAGMQPELSLDYSGSGGDGPLGFGWSLSGMQSAITRCLQSVSTEGKARPVRYDGLDRFCLDGRKLVAVGGGAYGGDGTQYRTETDSFALIQSFGSASTGPDTFTVRTKDSRLRTYSRSILGTRVSSGVGWNPDPVVGATSTTSPRIIWLLDSEKDSSGNEMRYEYTLGDGEFLTSKIRYTYSSYGTAPSQQSGQRYVEFVYENRPDVSFSYQSGVRYNSTQRLKSIDMYAPNPATTQLVWRYNLTYLPGVSNNNRSLLASVARCGSSGACMKAKHFTWTNPAAVPAFTPVALGTQIVNTTGSRDSFMHVADFDGDGADDILYTLGGTSDADSPVYMRLGTRNSAGAVSPLAAQRQVTGTGTFPAKTNLKHSRALDLEPDGAAEFATAFPNADPFFPGHVKVVRWNAGIQQFVDTGISYSSASHTEFADMNGDGRLDFVTADINTGSGFDYSVRLNTGGNFGAATPSIFTAGCPVRVSDTDGDGRAELIGAQPTTAGTCQNYVDVMRLEDNGLPFVDGSYVQSAGGVVYFRTLPTVSGYEVKLGDFNGDGLEDYLLAPSMVDPNTGDFTRSPALLWNTGNGLVLDTHAITIPLNTTGANAASADADLLITDINNDGRDDVVSLRTATTVAISRGDGTFTQGVIAPDSGTYDPGVGRATSKLGDFNGDGRIDVVRIVNHQMSVLLQSPTSLPDRLQSVQDEGVAWERESISYGNMWTDHPEKLSDYACASGLVCRRAGMVVVRSVTSKAHWVDVIIGSSVPTRTLYYSYEDPVTDLAGRGFLGFGIMRVFDPARPAETVTTYNHRKRVDGKYYPEVARPAVVITAVPIVTATSPRSGTTMETARVTRTVNTYETRKLNGGATYAVFDSGGFTKEWEQPVTVTWGTLIGSARTEHISDIVEPSTPLRRSDTVGVTFDDFGNPTSRTRHSGVMTEKVTISYDNRVADWLIGLPTRQTVTRYPAVTRTVDFTHDALGRLVKVEVEKDNSDPDVRKTTSYTYDSFGVRRSTRVAAPGVPDQVSHTEYVPVFPGQPDEKVYPSQVWSEHSVAAHQPSTWMAIHPAYGVTVATEDANGVLASATFDEFGRSISTTRDGQAPTTFSYAGRPDASGPTINGVIVTTTTASITTQASTDALGRRVQTTRTGFDGATAVASKTSYDLLGRVQTSTAAAPVGTTTYEYDSLDRPTKTTLPDGKTITYFHSMSTQGSATVMTDPVGNVTTRYIDHDGRLTAILQMLKKPDNTFDEIVTRYEYAQFDLLARVTDNKGNTTSMEYDMRGRRTKVTEPDRGTTTTSYFGTGSIRTVAHAATNHSITFTYDDLGRKTMSVSEDGTSTFVYDSAAHGIGALASATSPDNIRTDFRYDQHGRAAGVDYTDPSTNTTYQTDTGYDSAGRLSSVQYPDIGHGRRLFLQYDYLSHGYLSALRYARPGQSQLLELWTVNARQPNLALDTATLGNGVTVQRSYDTPTGRLHGLTATAVGGTRLQDLTYGYYDNGLVKTRTQNDSTGNRTETFTYDSLDRLTHWNLQNASITPKDIGYFYDTIGNIYPAGEDRTYSNPAGTPPHLLTSNNTSTPDGVMIYQHDGKGRQTAVLDDSSTLLRQVTYTAFDLPRSITKNGQTTTFAYDAFGQRFKKSSSTGTTITVGGLYQQRTMGRATKHLHYINGPDGPVAQVVDDGTNTDVQFQLTDALGSISATVNAAGAVTGSFYYAPFGQRITADGTAFAGTTSDLTHGFTNHEHDDDLRLINMKGRHYDPSLQRFLTPDPIVNHVADSRSWNPYSYVNNSPLNYTDPTGYVTCAFVQVGECEMPGGGAGYGTSGSGGASGGNTNSGGTTEDCNGYDCAWYNAQIQAEIAAFVEDAEAYSAGRMSTRERVERNARRAMEDYNRHVQADWREQARQDAAKNEAARNKKPGKSDQEGMSTGGAGEPTVELGGPRAKGLSLAGGQVVLGAISQAPDQNHDDMPHITPLFGPSAIQSPFGLTGSVPEIGFGGGVAAFPNRDQNSLWLAVGIWSVSVSYYFTPNLKTGALPFLQNNQLVNPFPWGQTSSGPAKFIVGGAIGGRFWGL